MATTIGKAYFDDGYNYIVLYAEETGTNIQNNTSSVHAWLDLVVARNVSSSGINVGVTGANNQDLGYRSWGAGTYRLVDGYYTANHNADGSGSTNVSGYFNSYVKNLSVSGTLQLTKIPRDFTTQPKITQGTVKPNSVVINWTTSQACDLI